MDFANCPRFAAINIDGSNPALSSINGVLFDKSGHTLLMFPPANAKTYIVPAGVTAIAPAAFYGGSGLNSVTIPGSVQTIGTNAFNSCFNLTNVTLLASVTTIRDGAFSGCGNL